MTGPKSVVMGTVFGLLASSCSFAAQSGARTLFAKGAGLVPSIFPGWQFVVGEYVGGLILIGLMWLAIRLTRRFAPIEVARARAQESQDEGDGDARLSWREKLRARDSWRWSRSAT